MLTNTDKIMKKTTVLLALLTICLGSFAQKKFQLGLQVAPNFSWIKANTDNVENDGLKFGFNYGIMGDFNFADNYAFSTGISLVNTGGKIIRPDIQDVPNSGLTAKGYGQTTADVRLKYIEIPLTLKLKTNEIGYLKYFGQFGFGLGVNYDATADEDFKYEFDAVSRTTMRSTPEAAIAFDRDYVTQLYKKAGLEISVIEPGSWARPESGFMLQDLIVAQKNF